MVNLTQILWKEVGRKRLPAGFSSRWIDSLRIYTKGGAGGTGLPKVGGLGGSGGNVQIVSSSKVKSLLEVRKKNPSQRFIASSGGNSRKVRLLGERGEDIKVTVPVGVSLVTDTGVVVGELLKNGDSCIVAKGGMGGNEATNFLGMPGERKSIKLDLKLIADVGLVGFPNAGKSTLLKAISRASPKIASYPFTTVQPNLGVASYSDMRTVSLADLPGLIEGAHLNQGMGHRFLKHVERTRLLLFMIDVDGFQFKADTPYRSPIETFLLLNRELELYREDLLTKPALCVLTKMDRKGAERSYDRFMEDLERFRAKLAQESRSEGDAQDSGAEKEEIYTQSKSLEASDRPELILPKRLVELDEVIPVSAKFSPKSVDLLKHRLRYWLDCHEDKEHEKKHDVDHLEAKVIETLKNRRNYF